MARLGQNFLVDRNLLAVIAREAELSERDVVLEVGGGAGILSAMLAERVRHVHVVEIDRALEPRLRAALVGREERFTLHFGDALELDLGALRPAPAKLVANLPYGIAATLILETIAALPALELWLAMVQREVGERLAAAPGSAAYGAPSVLAQLACEVRVVRAVSRTVFRPAPNVDSALVRLRRRGPAPPQIVRALVRDSFAHRRKALPRSLMLAPGAAPGVRERARAALRELGHPEDERAERLAPQEFTALAELLAAGERR